MLNKSILIIKTKTKGHEEALVRFGMCNMIVMIVSQMFAYVQTHHILIYICVTLCI